MKSSKILIREFDCENRTLGGMDDPERFKIQFLGFDWGTSPSFIASKTCWKNRIWIHRWDLIRPESFKILIGDFES